MERDEIERKILSTNVDKSYRYVDLFRGINNRNAETITPDKLLEIKGITNDIDRIIGLQILSDGTDKTVYPNGSHVILDRHPYAINIFDINRGNHQYRDFKCIFDLQDIGVFPEDRESRFSFLFAISCRDTEIYRIEMERICSIQSKLRNMASGVQQRSVVSNIDSMSIPQYDFLKAMLSDARDHFGYVYN
ncbi:hypothetical protein M1145_01115 [Patescibacteria group bacterium]|nr:hypothetical protein [Patescibacteria group bacterium]